MGPLYWWPALLVRAWDSLNGKCYGRRLSQSDQLYLALVINLCGPKQVQSADYLLRAASLSHGSALKCKIGPNSGLRHQHWGCEAADIVIAVWKTFEWIRWVFQVQPGRCVSAMLLSHSSDKNSGAGASSPRLGLARPESGHTQAMVSWPGLKA